MISALYIRKDSIYKEIAVDCWDIDRDARKWPGGNAAIAHPPCRAWGRLKGQAKPREDEKELAIIAIKQIRKWGGVVEHPEGSSLWDEMKLPKDGSTDEYGGYTISIDQSWFGHQSRKRTWLYIVGVKRKELPIQPISFNTVTKKLDRLGRKRREATPIELAQWLKKICEIINDNLY